MGDKCVVGACLGGVFWAVVIRLTIGEPDRPSPHAAWPVIAAVCAVMVALGLALARYGRRRVTRSAGVAMVIAPLTGAVILGFVGLFVAVGGLLQ